MIRHFEASFGLSLTSSNRLFTPESAIFGCHFKVLNYSVQSLLLLLVRKKSKRAPRRVVTV